MDVKTDFFLSDVEELTFLITIVLLSGYTNIIIFADQENSNYTKMKSFYPCSQRGRVWATWPRHNAVKAHDMDPDLDLQYISVRIKLLEIAF